jgi:hypothetical protein
MDARGLVTWTTAAYHPTQPDLQQRIRDYLDAGVQLLWVFYAEARYVMVHRPAGSAHRVRDTEALDGEGVLPGFRRELQRCSAKCECSARLAASRGPLFFQLQLFDPSANVVAIQIVGPNPHDFSDILDLTLRFTELRPFQLRDDEVFDSYDAEGDALEIVLQAPPKLFPMKCRDFRMIRSIFQPVAKSTTLNWPSSRSAASAASSST